MRRAWYDPSVIINDSASSRALQLPMLRVSYLTFYLEQKPNLQIINGIRINSESHAFLPRCLHLKGRLNTEGPNRSEGSEENWCAHAVQCISEGYRVVQCSPDIDFTKTELNI